jgi:hypothetical protein
MTPEERKGIEALVATMDGTEPAYAWLKKQLEYDEYDNTLERMGGGKKGRNSYMKPLFDKQCAVNMYDQHAQLMADGRERGLWIWLHDESKARAQRYDEWAEEALEQFCEAAGLADKGIERFRVAMRMDEFKRIANVKTDEAALLEWPAVMKLYTVIGEQLKKQKQFTKAEPKKKPAKVKGKKLR